MCGGLLEPKTAFLMLKYHNALHKKIDYKRNQHGKTEITLDTYIHIYIKNKLKGRACIKNKNKKNKNFPSLIATMSIW
jgi:hypothetical protein